jgi:hypothetical protein
MYLLINCRRTVCFDCAYNVLVLYYYLTTNNFIRKWKVIRRKVFIIVSNHNVIITSFIRMKVIITEFFSLSLIRHLTLDAYGR